jgi:hypothetical protein
MIQTYGSVWRRVRQVICANKSFINSTLQPDSLGFPLRSRAVLRTEVRSVFQSVVLAPEGKRVDPDDRELGRSSDQGANVARLAVTTSPEILAARAPTPGRCC